MADDLTVFDDPTIDDIRAMIPAVVKGYEADGGHAKWRQICTALKHYLTTVLKLSDEEAFAFVDSEFSRKCADFDEPKMAEDNQNQWASFRTDLPLTGKGGQPTVATIIRLASANGYKPAPASASGATRNTLLDRLAKAWGLL